MNRIVFDPKILSGKPIIKDTRISVDFVLELFASGMTEEEILIDYPNLKKEDIRAVFEYAAETIKKEEVIPIQ